MSGRIRAVTYDHPAQAVSVGPPSALMSSETLASVVCSATIGARRWQRDVFFELDTRPGRPDVQPALAGGSAGGRRLVADHASIGPRLATLPGLEAPDHGRPPRVETTGMGWSTFEYRHPTLIHWGPGSRGALDGLHGLAVALVTTRSLADCAHLLGLEPLQTVLVRQHAPVADIEDALTTLNGVHIDAIVSLGGGSPIDAAKIIALRLDAPPPHHAVPTTLSGAELAAGAGITDEAGDKVGLRDPRGMVCEVVYDAELSLLTPIDLWLSTGVRALDHALEGFLSPGSHPYEDVLCVEGARRLIRSLPAARQAPEDVTVRGENQLAAWLAYAQPAAAVGLSHVMGKAVGARHGIPHGVTSCILLPHVLRYRARREAERVAALQEALGEEPAAAVDRLVDDLGEPRRLAAYGLNDEDLRRAAATLAGAYPEVELLAVYRAAL